MLPVSAMAAARRGSRRAATLLIQLYQVALAPIMGPACRYEPSCSAYAKLAIERYGVLRGGWLALRRLLRCHPFAGCGTDPVP